MSDITFAREVCPVPVPVRELLPWAIFGGLILLLAIYFVGAEQGAMSLISGMYSPQSASKSFCGRSSACCLEL
jgi:hypothetical protein